MTHGKNPGTGPGAVAQQMRVLAITLGATARMKGTRFPMSRQQIRRKLIAWRKKTTRQERRDAVALELKALRNV